MAKSQHSAMDRTIRRYLLAGVATCILLVGGVGSLAAVTELSGAVIASGKFVVDSSVKKVQHPTGGVVGQILVREGDAVKSGEILVRLDETVTRANLAVVIKALDEFEARLARLEAERDGKNTIVFPPELVARKDVPEAKRAMDGEQSLFGFRRQARDGLKGQLEERIAQLGEEVSGLTEQKTAKTEEIRLIGTELDSIRKLWKNKLVSIERMTALERDAVRLQGEHGQLTAAIAQANGRISETRLQIIQIGQDLRSEVATELRDLQGKISEFVERKVSAEDQLRRIDIRSPQDGVVHQLEVHTVGGVIAPGELIMQIVPVADDLTVEAHVAPQDIDQLSPNQPATLRLSAFSQQTTPELNGTVGKISADLRVDERSGIGYYTVHVNLPRAELAKIKGLTLAPGMPVEAFFSTGSRSMLSYLVKPLADQIQRAFREE